VKSLTAAHHEYLAGAVRSILPEATLIGAACALFLLAAFAPRRRLAVPVALLGIAAAAAVALLVGVEAFRPVLGLQELDVFRGPVAGTDYRPHTIAPFDPTGAAGFVRWLALAAAGLFVLLSWAETRDDDAGEYLACLLVAAAGVSLAGRANDLVTLFLSLELISIPTYVLLALASRSRPGHEATVKYFLLSVLSSAVLLFGFSYLYGLTGSTNIGAVCATLAAAHREAVNPLALVAIVMVVAGLAFRITAVPFHFYAPDVYEGGPTGVVAQLAVFPKIAGFAALVRVLGMLYPGPLPFDATATLIPLTLWVLAAVTMTFGNLLALLQDNLRRLMAYSGIAHGGYMLVTLVVVSNGVPTAGGLDALLFYLAAYALMTVGVFAMLLHLARGPQPAETVDDLAGLGQTHPASAAVLAVCLLSLIGIPLTAGFAGKFLILVGAFDLSAAAPMQAMTRALAVVTAVNAAVGAVYYLRILNVMYLRTPLREVPAVRGVSLPRAVGVACAVATVVLGVYPKPLGDAARRAVERVAVAPPGP